MIPEIEKYDTTFFNVISSNSLGSAKEAVPTIINIVSPKSVLDIGCGTGDWLSVFSNLGIKDIKGIDGDYVDLSSLKIDKSQFESRNLEIPFDLHRKYDLVISLEVAEHLPPACAKNFVETLTTHGDLVLFSAAVPGQVGTNHLNEQWQDYWANLFKESGYIPFDLFRPLFWYNPRITWWYKQNMVLYVRQSADFDFTKNKKPAIQLKKMHPEMLFGLKGARTDWDRLVISPSFFIMRFLKKHHIIR